MLHVGNKNEMKNKFDFDVISNYLWKKKYKHFYTKICNENKDEIIFLKVRGKSLVIISNYYNYLKPKAKHKL